MKKKWSVLITRYLYGDAWKDLLNDCEVTYDMNRLLPYSKAELIEAIKNKDAVLSMGDSMDAEVLAAAPNLKVIIDMWGGSNIDHEYCKQHGIYIAGHDFDKKWIIHSEVEHILMMLLAVTRRIKEADAFVRAGRFQVMDQANKEMLGTGLKGKTLGILGGTRWSGEELTRVAKAFLMNVKYWDFKRGEEMEESGAVYTPFNELLASCDFLALVVLAGKQEGYLLDKKEFDRMKPGMVILNVTHGYYINETELVKAIKAGKVGGVGLDKLEKETVASEGLLSLPGVLLTPHADGAVKEAREAIFNSMVAKVKVQLDKSADRS